MSALNEVIETLRTRHRRAALPYLVPGLWVGAKATIKRAVNPFEVYGDRLKSIRDAQPRPLVQGGPGGDWSQQAIVYNMFPRVTAAFDHNDDGQIDLHPRPDGWRETGTLLKATALLPYIRGMGFNTVHLLPITSVGQDGKKGTLGSPYAIRNPYQLDENLAEPALDLPAETLFAAFVEAAHHLGMRVVMEFVLRTASKDSDWIKEHPDWFYWIREDVPDRAPNRYPPDPLAYGSPVFPPGTLDEIRWKVSSGTMADLPPPPDAYRRMFTVPPRPDQVTMENGRWIGTLDDGARVRVPGAFSDWPPDDGQPPWSDVTYLRMYDHPDFNYMAYNTLRMYDTRLARPKHANQPLWDAVAGVIPHHQGAFGIDGVLLDMGHALPVPLMSGLVARAREINPDFAFWEENFTISPQSRGEGYNAVVGYMIFDMHLPGMLRRLIEWLARDPLPIPFFAAAENHNTPRAAARENGNRAYAYYTLPFSIATQGIPFIHSGFELRETQPINTGLNFTPEMLARYPTEKLPLFSEWAFNWTREDNLVQGITYALSLRHKYAALLTTNDPHTWKMGWSDNPHILVFTRHAGALSLSFIANTDLHHHQAGRVVFGGREYKTQGVWGTPDPIAVYHDLNMFAQLSPGYVLILEGDDVPLNGL